jgi:hypothetical protein
LQWIFWLKVPISAPLIPLALLRLKESYGPEGRLALAGPKALRPSSDRPLTIAAVKA